MCKNNKVLKYVLCFLITCGGLSGTALLYASTASDFSSIPPFVTTGAASNVMLDLSVETPMQGSAYNDQDDLASGGSCAGRKNVAAGEVGRCYSNTQKYLGIFDPNKVYDYLGGRFVPVGYVTVVDADYSTSGHFSGNFLNWATMTAID